MALGRSIVDKASEVKEWIKEISVKRGELGGHAICPYAFSASVKIVERALNKLTLKAEFVKFIEIENYEVAIFIVEDDVTLPMMLQTMSELSMMFSDYVFLDDHKDDPTFINGIQSNFGKHNLIIVQKRDKLLKAREQLAETNYYGFWTKEMYERIVNGKLTSGQE